MIKITDIAKKSGVSRGTVDRVLHNRKGVKSDVALRVQTIADELGYVPNKAGKILAARKQKIILGCLLPDIGNPFFADVIVGFKKAESELSDYNVSIRLYHVKGFDSGEHARMIATMFRDGCSGMCLTTMDVPEIQNSINTVISKGVPVVMVNTRVNDVRAICYVGPDYYLAGRTAAGLFAMTEHKQQTFLMITGSFNIPGHMERIRGFRECLCEKKFPFSVDDIFESNDNDECSYLETKRRLQEKPGITTVFIAAAGVEGACRAVDELGLPIHVIAFDVIPATKKYVQEGLIDFTICQEPVEQGYLGATLLFSYLMEEGKRKIKDHITRCIIKIRENINEV